MRAMLLAVLAAGLVSGCATVQQTADKTSICVDAVQTAGLIPDQQDPRHAVQEARDAAEHLNALAAQTPDQTLKQALTGMAASVGSFDPADAAAWVGRKSSQLDALRRACT